MTGYTTTEVSLGSDLRDPATNLEVLMFGSHVVDDVLAARLCDLMAVDCTCDGL